jgi:hypothetical protein
MKALKSYFLPVCLPAEISYLFSYLRRIFNALCTEIPIALLGPLPKSESQSSVSKFHQYYTSLYTPSIAQVRKGEHALTIVNSSTILLHHHLSIELLSSLYLSEGCLESIQLNFKASPKNKMFLIANFRVPSYQNFSQPTLNVILSHIVWNGSRYSQMNRT